MEHFLKNRLLKYQTGCRSTGWKEKHKTCSNVYYSEKEIPNVY